MLTGMMARPAATSLRTNSGVISFGMRCGNLLENGRREFAAGELLRTGVLLVELVADDVVRHVRDAGAAHVLADGDEFHLRRDDAGAGVLQLRDDLARLGAERLAALAEQTGKFHEPILLRRAGELGVFAGKIAVVHRLHFATVVFLHVAAFQNPVAAQRGQTFVGLAGERRIAPRPAAIIDAHGRILLDSHRCKIWCR